jgi:transcriptional regulator GlxA family with amidase domain
MNTRCRVIGFLLVDGFSMMSFSSAVEALRQANRLAAAPLFDWYTCTVGGGAATCSAGIRIDAAFAVDATPEPDLLLVVSATSRPIDGEQRVHRRLRYLARRGAAVGALTFGAYVLARAGLLEGHRCTVHWETLEAFREAFPTLEVSGDLFEIDGGRYTCSGGTAALDMMLHLIAHENGEAFASAVADQFLHHRVRGCEEHQRMPLRSRIGVSHPKLLRCVELLEQDTAAELSREQLAERVGLSNRQLERLFRKYLHTTPSRYTMDHRLKRARALLRDTSLSIIEVAVACGFTSHSHFSKSYRQRFGTTPRDERRSVASRGAVEAAAERSPF